MSALLTAMGSAALAARPDVEEDVIPGGSSLAWQLGALLAAGIVVLFVVVRTIVGHRIGRAGPFGLRLLANLVASAYLILITIEAVGRGQWVLLLAVAGSLFIVGVLTWGAWVRYRAE